MRNEKPLTRVGRRLPQFHLRDLLWLIVVVTLACGWFVNFRAAGKASARLQYIVAERKAAEQASIEPSTPTPVAPQVRERATAVAQAFLADQQRQQRVDDWGEPVLVRAGEGEDVLVEYQTPSHELQLLGTRAIRVHCDNWTAAWALRD